MALDNMENIGQWWRQFRKAVYWDREDAETVIITLNTMLVLAAGDHLAVKILKDWIEVLRADPSRYIDALSAVKDQFNLGVVGCGLKPPPDGWILTARSAYAEVLLGQEALKDAVVASANEATSLLCSVWSVHIRKTRRWQEWFINNQNKDLMQMSKREIVCSYKEIIKVMNEYLSDSVNLESSVLETSARYLSLIIPEWRDAIKYVTFGNGMEWKSEILDNYIQTICKHSQEMHDRQIFYSNYWLNSASWIRYKENTLIKYDDTFPIWTAALKSKRGELLAVKSVIKKFLKHQLFDLFARLRIANYNNHHNTITTLLIKIKSLLSHLKLLPKYETISIIPIEWYNRVMQADVDYSSITDEIYAIQQASLIAKYRIVWLQLPSDERETYGAFKDFISKKLGFNEISSVVINLHEDGCCDTDECDDDAESLAYDTYNMFGEQPANIDAAISDTSAVVATEILRSDLAEDVKTASTNVVNDISTNTVDSALVISFDKFVWSDSNKQYNFDSFPRTDVNLILNQQCIIKSLSAQDVINLFYYFKKIDLTKICIFIHNIDHIKNWLELFNIKYQESIDDNITYAFLPKDGIIPKKLPNIPKVLINFNSKNFSIFPAIANQLYMNINLDDHLFSYITFFINFLILNKYYAKDGS